MALQSITTGPRQSNFEALRLIAMFFVLMVHANFMSIGAPSVQDFSDNFIPSATRILLESVSLFGVNVFIMISGWFSIKATVKGLSALLFQVFYFGITILLFLTLTGEEQFTFGRIYQIALLHKCGWFVMSYLILYLLSPVLNKFSEYTSKEEFRNFLIPYFIMLVIWGSIDWAEEIGMGFSSVSFVGVYLLARYARKYIDFKYGGWLFLVCWLLHSVSYVFLLHNIPFGYKTYDSPFIILGALGLVMHFSQLRIGGNTSVVINYIAKSTFAVYLLHIYPDVLDRFCNSCKNIYYETSGAVCLMQMALLLLGVYISAIMLDAPRRFIWSGFVKLIRKRK